MRSVVRFCLQLLITLLQAGLFVWASCAPLVWILRDGLGPDSRESGWGLSIRKFAVGWGVPALALAASLFGLVLMNRRLAAGKRNEPLMPRWMGVSMRRISVCSLMAIVVFFAVDLAILKDADEV